MNNRTGQNGIYSQIHVLASVTNIPVSKILEMIDEGTEYKGYTFDINF